VTPEQDTAGAVTAAGAYEHAARLADLVALRARREASWTPEQVWVRVERVEHLVAGLRARAQEAARLAGETPT
jgi:hypothetical protein